MATAGRLLVIALPLYFAWEMLQAPAFTGMPERWRAATAVCAQAALGDGVIVLALHALGALMFRDGRWFAPPRLGRYAAIVVLGVVVQVAVEWVMVHRFERWGYDPLQPVLPLVAVGMLPVLQAAVLVPSTFWALARWEWHVEARRNGPLEHRGDRSGASR